MNENLDTDYKLSSKESNINQNKFDFNIYKIEKITLFIILFKLIIFLRYNLNNNEL